MSETSLSPLLSIIIPAYNEERRLPTALVRITDFLRRQPFASEVLIVENGSTDGTTIVVKDFIENYVKPDDPFQIILLQSDKGKGNAVKHGILQGRGEYLLVSDTDLAVPIEETSRFLPPLYAPSDYGIAIASREVKGAVRHGEPAYRHLMGRVFNFLVRLLVVPRIHDTQCGFKCFSRDVAQLIFPLQQISGWGFDAEVLFIAQKHGIPIVEIPVNWYYGDDSRIRPIQDTINMFTDLLRIRRNARMGTYDLPATATVADNLTTAS